MGSPAGISSSTDAAASTFASRSSSIRLWRSSAGLTTPRRSATCSASRIAGSCAGTTSSRSPSSRSPTTSARCWRSRSRSRTLAADTLGLALARILGIADRLLDESKDWLWLGGRMPDKGDRTPPTRRSSTGTRRGCRSCWGRMMCPRRPTTPTRPRNPPSPSPLSARRVSRRLVLLLAVVAATGLLATPVGSRRGPCRHARPDDRRQRPLRRPARRRSASGSRSISSLTNHLQRHEDQALLLRSAPSCRSCPALRVQADLAGAGAATARPSRRRPRPTRSSSSTSGDGSTAARPTPTGCVFDLVDTGGAATRDVRVGDVPRVVPGLGVRHRLDPGELGQGRPSRPATRSPSSRVRSRRRRPRRRDDHLRDRQARQAAHVLRLPRRRSAGRLRRADRDGDGQRRRRSS